MLTTCSSFTADIEHRIPLLCYSKCNSILLHGRYLAEVFVPLLSPQTIFLLHAQEKLKKCSFCSYIFSGLLLGRVHIYYKSHPNARAAMHCNWSLFFTPLHSLCSSCKYLVYLYLYSEVYKFAAPTIVMNMSS